MAPIILIFSAAMGAHYSFYVKSIDIHARAFLTLNSFAIDRVCPPSQRSQINFPHGYVPDIPLENAILTRIKHTTKPLAPNGRCSSLQKRNPFEVMLMSNYPGKTPPYEIFPFFTTQKTTIRRI